MTFAATISKVFGKRPIWLYRFDIGPVAYEVTSNGAGHTTAAGAPDATYASTEFWTPQPGITHSRITQTTQSNRAEITIGLPTSSPIAQAVMQFNDVSEIGVTIWQTFTDDADQDYVVRFRGRVIAPRFGYVATTLACEAGFTRGRRTLLAPIMQRPCRHVHYFPRETDTPQVGCNLRLEDHQIAADVTAASGASLTVPVAALQPDGRYLAGILEYDGVEYDIIGHIGSTLLIERRIPALEDALVGGDVPVLIAPGCNLSPTDCEFFNNIENFGGFPEMLDTPFDGRSIV
ncbi:hypothetical protein [Halovulum sp. GXIMD14793]